MLWISRWTNTNKYETGYKSKRLLTICSIQMLSMFVAPAGRNKQPFIWCVCVCVRCGNKNQTMTTETWAWILFLFVVCLFPSIYIYI